jgi:hypothetical protein
MAGDAEPRLMVRREGKWRPMSVQPYENEDVLQGLLHETPSLLPGVSGDAVAAREFEVPGVGFVDLVVVDADGSITLVECKLRSNPQIRREVVGQILAYASGIWRLPLTEFAVLFDKAAGESTRHLASISSATVDDGGAAISSSLADALADGRFRLCIAVDQITDELRDIVEFLNTHSSEGIEVVLFEVGIVTDGDVQVMVPRTFGGESARLKVGSSEGSKRRWTFDDVLTRVENVSGADIATAIRKLDSFFREVGWSGVPGRGATPTWSLYARVGGLNKSLITVMPYDSGKWGRSLTLNLGSFVGVAADGSLARLLSELRGVAALAPYLDGISGVAPDTYPVIPLDALSDATPEALIAALRTHLVEGDCDA